VSRILAKSDLEALGLPSATTIWRMERDGRFPRRFKLSARRVGWLEDDVLAWINVQRESA
jgi:prophage regulatory protein